MQAEAFAAVLNLARSMLALGAHVLDVAVAQARGDLSHTPFDIRHDRGRCEVDARIGRKWVIVTHDEQEEADHKYAAKGSFDQRRLDANRFSTFATRPAQLLDVVSFGEQFGTRAVKHRQIPRKGHNK